VCAVCMRSDRLSLNGAQVRFCYGHRTLEAVESFDGTHTRCRAALARLKAGGVLRTATQSQNRYHILQGDTHTDAWTRFVVATPSDGAHALLAQRRTSQAVNACSH
jgi:hypothetical protein